MNRLADLFSPRAGRDARYRVTTLKPRAAATGPNVIGALAAGFGQATQEPLTVFISGHGDRGQRAADNAVLLWGGYDLRPHDIAKALAKTRGGRPVQFVITSCFSGGFAEIIFQDARSAQGPAAGPVRACGLFAAPWDRESTGCDPDPDRRKHDGYGLHFLQALRGNDKLGQPLGKQELDADGDGQISLLEAHTRARIMGRGMDLPTTTSERWIRFVDPPDGPESDVWLPEEDAVIAALSPRLKGREAATELGARRGPMEALQERLATAKRAEQESYLDVAAHLLARWPVLDDPWHPDFATTLRQNRAAIEAWFRTATLYARHRRRVTEVDTLTAAVDEALVAAAPLERLARAISTKRLAQRLRALGGAHWDRYAALLACERSTPPNVR